MPNFNHKGPERKGSKTGKKLGKCRKKDNELTQVNTHKQCNSTNKTFCKRKQK